MRLTMKLASLIVAAVVLSHIIDGYLSVHREIDLFENDMRNDVRLLGLTLEGLVAHVWQSSGEKTALASIADANEKQNFVDIRWVWISAPPGSPFAPAVPEAKLKKAMLSGNTMLVRRDSSGVRRIYHYVPVNVGTGRSGALELSKNASYADRYIQVTILRTGILTVALIAVTAVIVGIAGVSMVGRPLSELTMKARRIGSGDLEGKVRIRGRDELSVLAATMNEMCEQLAAAIEKMKAESDARIAAIEQLRHADRLKTVGRLASGIAHELGTPLNVVSGRASLIAGGTISADEVTHSANVIKQQVDRITALIRQLLDFARRRSQAKTAHDLRPIVDETLDLLKPQVRKQNCELNVVADDAPVMAPVDPTQVQQAVTNLVVNALQAMPRGGQVQVELHRVRARPRGLQGGEEADYACLTVRDQGVGIPDEIRNHLFEPFFTTKEIGEGTGLGLSIVYGIVAEHGGWIDVESRVDKGTRFDIYLPADPSS